MQSFRASRTLTGFSGATEKPKHASVEGLTESNTQSSSTSNSSSKSSAKAPSSGSSSLAVTDTEHGIRSTRATTPETLFGKDASDATPRPRKVQPDVSALPREKGYAVSPNGLLGPAKPDANSRPVSLAFDKSIFEGSPYLEAKSETTKAQSAETGPRKVMTKAEFERRQQEQDKVSNHEDANDSGSDYDEDEDEAEQKRKAVSQRRKQEAQLAVYRQQIKKQTGEQPRELAGGINRPAFDRASYSTPELVTSAGALAPGTSIAGAESKSSDEDSDENVPLAYLQAAGFPNKNRPPTKPRGSAASFVVRPPSMAGSQTQRPISASGLSAAAERPRSGLPPFARKLPADPYSLGAGLVNQTNRESLSFSRKSTTSVYGASNPAPQTPQHGGLIGIIAREEHAKALRRGGAHSYAASPAAEFNPRRHSQQTAAQQAAAQQVASSRASVMMGSNQSVMSVAPNQGMVPAMSGGASMSEQMNQFQQMMTMQMSQFMQMQSQMQMQGQMPMQGQMQMQPSQQQFMPVQQGAMPYQQGAMPYQQYPMPQQMGNNMLAPAGGPMRPMSMAVPAPGFPQQRTMSMMNQPSNLIAGNRWTQMAPAGVSAASVHHLPAGPSDAYAPSIAPSERSNVGMAPRYRPVSHVPDSTSATSSGVPTVTSPPEAQSKKSATVRAVEKIKGLGGKSRSPNRHDGPQDDDSDDEGWSSMKKRKERVRTARPDTSSSTTPPLKDLYFEGI